jgi:hypothetical protein
MILSYIVELKRFGLGDFEQTQNTSVFSCHRSTNLPYTRKGEYQKVNTKISERKETAPVFSANSNRVKISHMSHTHRTTLIFGEA